MFPDLGLDQLPEVAPEPFMGALLIGAHEARVPRHVGRRGLRLGGGQGTFSTRRSIGLTKSNRKPAAALAATVTQTAWLGSRRQVGKQREPLVEYAAPLNPSLRRSPSPRL
jgi:hypothetical protein